MRQNKNKPTREESEPINIEEAKAFINEWNEKVKEIPESYLKLKPKNGYVLVRMYKTIMNSYIFEQVGQGTNAKIERIQNPFPYSNKAVVVASERNYESMEEVIIDPQAIHLIGHPEIGKFPQFLFMTDELQDRGYLLIPEHFIRVVL